MPQKFLVIGNPVKHSLSPILHQAGYKELGLDATFSAYEVSDLAKEWDYLRGFQGFAVTMPWKQEIRKYLDSEEPAANAVGAVNTVTISGGLVSGGNTDIYGIAQAIRAASGRDHFARLAIIGGRASACSALAASGELGRPQVTAIARTLSGPGTIAAASAKLGVNVTYLPWRLTEKAQAAISEADLVISTVPSAAAAELTSGLKVSSQAVLLEAAYSDPQRPLSQTFAAQGATVVPGTDMLFYQALAQFQIMTGYQAPAKQMREALDQARRERGINA
ncbi:hypothetical protein BK816_04300 [Boudabousia tangfeifanii]|uniref:Shikimate dehydrogenase substrate binding N-terminal domain-containing protein n=1 Tax=Boudabousia tangfeifanii TaxID=1912795 RepID=A0A1D9MK01_9ACTO|nr:hypothetical protein [Boudabousia tangfeifanii]AOZ72612.1 hypothetical protein BK816_04300 [Boudabousia tangfeifanii]